MSASLKLTLLVTIGATTAMSCGRAPHAPSESEEPAVGAAARSRVASASDTTHLRVALGARLFEDARLSLDSTMSCATCHMPSRAFTEPRTVSHGIGGRARKRNTPSLISVAVFRSNFDWDGRAKTLKTQLRGVFSVAGDMGIDAGEAVARLRTDRSYDRPFRSAFGQPVDVDAFMEALVAFQQSLVGRFHCAL